MNKLLKICIASLGILVLSSCEGEIEIVEVPECTIGAKLMYCHIPEEYPIPASCTPDGEDREYECPLSEAWGYQATSPEGYEDLRNDIDEKLKELAKLRKKCEPRKSVKSSLLGRQ